MNNQYKILAVVRFNSGEALVLDKKPELNYSLSNGCITGTDGIFCECLYYDRMGPHWRAFGGRKFDIKLTNGEIVHCEGQYWDGIMQEHINQLGETPIQVTAACIDNLKKCYVFSGYKAIRQAYDDFRKSYTGIVYEYWDYDAILKGRK